MARGRPVVICAAVAETANRLLHAFDLPQAISWADATAVRPVAWGDAGKTLSRTGSR